MPSSSPKRAATSALARADAENGVAVTVGDTGIGMDPQDVEIAFQPFGQVDNRLERRYEGTGLGLPLTKALVDLHKGRIAIDSARGRGTRVTVAFPRAISESCRKRSGASRLRSAQSNSAMAWPSNRPW